MKIVFQPEHYSHGERLRFTKNLFAKKGDATTSGWFVFGYESTGQHYGGRYIRRVAWPKNQNPKHYQPYHVKGWRTRAEAKKVVAILNRALRMGKFK